MKPFLTSKRKMIELLVLLGFNIVFYLLWSSFDVIALFSLGFIWNWVASQNLDLIFENRPRYRFSMLRTVLNLQSLFLKPFEKSPAFVKFFIRIVPAGVFWFAVIYFNDSQMPWWMVFLGSFAFEIIQLDSKIFKREKELIP